MMFQRRHNSSDQFNLQMRTKRCTLRSFPSTVEPVLKMALSLVGYASHKSGKH